ncbi:MAG: MFS transporter [Dehalococcoidia bacterium]
MSNIPVLTVLHSRDFRLLWSARSIHESSRRMELLVLGYLILSLTDSAFQVGLIAVFLNGPRPLLSLFAGLIADRLDRHRVLIGVHTVYLLTASTILALVVLEAIHPWFVFAAVLFQGTAKVVDDPSRRTAIFDLAGPEHISSAMSLETITNNIGKILGPLSGGLLIAGTGFVGAFSVLVALDLASLIFILMMRLPRRESVSRLQVAVWASLRAGIKHSVVNRMSLGVLSVSLVMNALVLPIQYFIPVIASDLLLVGPALGGVLGSAEGIGTLLGASIISVRRNIQYHGRVFVGGALVIALGVTLMAWSPWFIVSFVLLLLAGMGQAGFSTMQATILLLSSPPEMRGRIMGSQGLVNGVGHLVGGSEIGAIASAFGISLAIGLNAGVGLALILLVAALTPLVKQQVRPASDEAGPTSTEPVNPQQLPVEESID